MKNILMAVFLSVLLISCSSVDKKKGKASSEVYTKGSVSGLPSSFSYVGCDLSRLKKQTNWKMWLGVANACVAAKNWFQLSILSERMLVDYPDSPWGNYYASLVAEQKGQTRKAYWMIDRALNKTPDVGLFTFQKARLTLSAGERFRAIQMLRNSIEQDASLEEAKKYLGLLSFEDEDYKTCVSLLEKLPKDLVDKNVHISLMESYFHLGNNDQALSLAEDLSKRSTDNWTFRYRKAQLLERYPEKKKLALKEYVNLNESVKKSENPQKIATNLPDKIESLKREIAKMEEEASSKDEQKKK